MDPDGKESNTGKLVSYNDSCTLVLSIDPDSKTFNAMISDHTSGVDLTFSGKSGDVFSKDQNGGRGKAIALSIDVVGASADSGPGASGLVVSNSVSQWTPGTAAGGGSGITLAATAGNSNQSNNGNFNGAGDVPAPVDLQTSVPVSQ